MESKLENYLADLKESRNLYKNIVEKIEADVGKSLRENNKSKIRTE